MAEAKQVLYSPIDIEDAQYADFEPDAKMQQENEEFEAFKAEMHDAQFDAKITVGKKLTDSQGRPMGRQVFECFECGIEDYTFSQICNRIREDFGTGLYQVRGRDSKGKFKFNKVVGILAPNTPDNKPAGQDVGTLIDKFSDAMQRQQMRTEEMFTKLVGPQSGGDAFDQMTKMMTAMGGMMGAMGINPVAPQPPKTLIEQLTEFKLLKELLNDTAEGGGGEANLYSLLGKTVEAFGGPIAAAIAAGSESGQLNPEGVAQLPAPEPEQPTELEKVQTEEQEKLALRKTIHVLIQNAKTGIPPEAFALILINNTPPEKEDDLWNFISSETCVDEIVAVEPAADPYREWFENLRTEVIHIMTEPEGESEGEPGDLQGDETGSKVPDVDAVAGGDSLPDAADKSDTSSDT